MTSSSVTSRKTTLQGENSVGDIFWNAGKVKRLLLSETFFLTFNLEFQAIGFIEIWSMLGSQAELWQAATLSYQPHL